MLLEPMRIGHLTQLGLSALAALILASCLGPSEPIALTVSLTATPATAAVGDLVDFRVTARGAGIGIVRIEFGDGADEFFSAGGANNTTVTFPHAYETAGTFQAKVTATDTRGSDIATTSVTIQ
jgi:PKD repeat protein